MMCALSSSPAYNGLIINQNHPPNVASKSASRTLNPEPPANSNFQLLTPLHLVFRMSTDFERLFQLNLIDPLDTTSSDLLHKIPSSSFTATMQQCLDCYHPLDDAEYQKHLARRQHRSQQDQDSGACGDLCEHGSRSGCGTTMTSISVY